MKNMKQPLLMMLMNKIKNELKDECECEQRKMLVNVQTSTINNSFYPTSIIYPIRAISNRIKSETSRKKSRKLKRLEDFFVLLLFGFRVRIGSN